MLENKNNKGLGVLGIILGIIVIAFPVFSELAGSILAGLGLIFLGIWLMALSFDNWGYNNLASLAALVVSIAFILIGVTFIGNVILFELLLDAAFYLVGFLLITSGIILLIKKEDFFNKIVGFIGIITGFLYFIMAYTQFNPEFLALVLGLWLIFGGAAQFLPRKENQSIDYSK